MIKYAFVAPFVIGLTGCSEIIEMYYPDYPSAIAAGAVDQGWLPGWLPESARDINEAHDIDTNQSILSFVLPTAEWHTVQHRCVAIAGAKVQKAAIAAEWWPRALSASGHAGDHLAHFSCDNGMSFMAVSKVDGYVYFWRP